MRALRLLALTLLTTGLLCATAYGAGYALLRHDGGTTTTARPAPSPHQAADRDPTPVEAPNATPTEQPKRAFRLEGGDHGPKVRQLQARLHQIAWLPELTTGRYDADTVTAVEGFQVKRGLRASGITDQRTWRRLKAMTERPTHDQMFNVLHPGPALLEAGQSGEKVRDLQARLVATAWLFGDVTGEYDDATVEAVRGFQEKREIPVTGEVDQRTMDRLHAMTSTPSRAAMYNEPEPGQNIAGALDARCTTGRALCIDKTSSTLRWVVDGTVRRTLDVRFGASYAPTREGLFHVYWKDVDHVSDLYGSEMPYSMFFSRGQAVHYSSDFAARGYAGASHGCVNVRDREGLAALFAEAQVGDKVVVYWS